MSSTSERGLAAEERAAQFLRARGYRIEERNYRCPAGELDIIAWDGDTLVFVEVRSRRDHRYGNAAHTVTEQKRRQLTRVAASYLFDRAPTFSSSRFDVVGVTGDELLLFRDAFRMGI